MHSFTINEVIGEITHGPTRSSDGLPSYVEWNGEVYDTPRLETLQSWTWASVVETLDGSSIEPDGWTYDGCPSWLLALNIV